MTVMKLDEILAAAWADPKTTKTELPPVDVNQVLRDHYDVAPDLTYTRSMLWDMEIRKASAPDMYIPSAVKPGSAEKFGAGADFTRVSEQRLWLNRDAFGTIIEQVHLDQDRQSVEFVGLPEFQAPDRRGFTATTDQPLFHVEHWVDGVADQPLNRWRIMFLTTEPDQRLVDFFAELGQSPHLRDFVEIHIRDVLGHTLTRRD
jgi:hypothetical protein